MESPVSPLLQGLFFAALNVVLLERAADALRGPLGLPTELLPRVLVFHGCACLALGSVLLESFAARLTADGRAVVGPAGTFLAAWAGLFALALAALLSGEQALLVPACFAVGYTVGLAKARAFQPAPVGTAAAALALLMGLVVLLVEAEAVAQAAASAGRALGLPGEGEEGGPGAPPGYLMGPGGALHDRWFAIGFTTLGSYALMWSLAPSPGASRADPASLGVRNPLSTPSTIHF
jgi:hypothetical protein